MDEDLKQQTLYLAGKNYRTLAVDLYKSKLTLKQEEANHVRVLRLSFMHLLNMPCTAHVQPGLSQGRALGDQASCWYDVVYDFFSSITS